MAIQAQLYSDNIGLQLAASQDWNENASHGLYQFCLNPQQEKQQPQFLLNQQLQADATPQQMQNLYFDRSVLLPRNFIGIGQSMAHSACVTAQIEKQSQEVDRFIGLQNERLRLALEEHRKQLITLVLKKYEPNVQLLLRQKDEEMSKATRRAVELEEIVNRMTIENQIWQRVAREKEAMVMSLNNAIEQLKESACLASNGVDDAESCCDMTDNDNYDRGAAAAVDDDRHQHPQMQGRNDEQITRKMICKSCNSRSSSVVLLPCRHLCSCNACVGFLDSCPVCKMVKKASIEVLI